MELRHLESFVAVAEELHFGRAAERLHVAQSPFSQRIRMLERELGVTLLERTNRHVELTEAGAAFLVEARRTLRAAAAAARTAARHREGEEGTLRLAFVASVAFDVLPALLRALRADTPDLGLDLRRLGSAAQVDALLAHEIQAGIARYRPDGAGGLDVLDLPDDPFVVALPAGDPAVSEDPVRLGSLRDRPWILARGSSGSELDDRVRGACATAGFRPRVEHVVPDQVSILALVAAGLGVSVVPRGLASLGVPGVVIRPLHDADRFALPTHLVWRADDRSPALARLRRAALGCRWRYPAEGISSAPVE